MSPPLSGSDAVWDNPLEECFFALFELWHHKPSCQHSHPSYVNTPLALLRLKTPEDNTHMQMPSRTHSCSDIPWQAAPFTGAPSNTWVDSRPLCWAALQSRHPLYSAQFPNPVPNHLPPPLPLTDTCLTQPHVCTKFLGREQEEKLFDIFRAITFFFNF